MGRPGDKGGNDGGLELGAAWWEGARKGVVVRNSPSPSTHGMVTRTISAPREREAMGGRGRMSAIKQEVQVTQEEMARVSGCDWGRPSWGPDGQGLANKGRLTKELKPLKIFFSLWPLEMS